MGLKFLIKLFNRMIKKSLWQREILQTIIYLSRCGQRGQNWNFEHERTHFVFFHENEKMICPLSSRPAGSIDGRAALDDGSLAVTEIYKGVKGMKKEGREEKEKQIGNDGWKTRVGSFCQKLCGGFCYSLHTGISHSHLWISPIGGKQEREIWDWLNLQWRSQQRVKAAGREKLGSLAPEPLWRSCPRCSPRCWPCWPWSWSRHPPTH